MEYPWHVYINRMYLPSINKTKKKNDLSIVELSSGNPSSVGRDCFYVIAIFVSSFYWVDVVKKCIILSFETSDRMSVRYRPCMVYAILFMGNV